MHSEHVSLTILIFSALIFVGGYLYSKTTEVPLGEERVENISDTMPNEERPSPPRDQLNERRHNNTPVAVLLAYMDAASTCDFQSRDSLITELSRDLISNSSCSAWKTEVGCYSQKNLTVTSRGNTAFVYTDPPSHTGMPPFMLMLEDGSWKIDFSFMARNIVFSGSGACAYPWQWKNTSSERLFCDMSKACD